MTYNLCLDLDNTLIYTITDPRIISKIDLNDPDIKKRCRLINIVDILDNDKKGIGNVTKMLVIFRPYLFEFLDFSKKYFSDIIIWSAGQDRYVKAIDYLIFPNEKPGQIPSKIFSYADCVFLYDGTTFKELKEKNLDLKKTLVLDDREDTFSKNKENGILIPIYCPLKNETLTKNDIMKDDKSLLYFIEWLKKNNNSDDVRKLKKENIFTI